VALTIPLVGVTLEATPTAAACTPPICRLQSCEFVMERPTFDPKTMEFDPGLVGFECGTDEES
jgi:hypothetical protein